MTQVLREEVNAVHGRINDMSNRLTALETQMPHMRDTLERIERNFDDTALRLSRSIESLKSHAARFVWIVLALFITALFKIAMTGNLRVPGL